MIIQTFAGILVVYTNADLLFMTSPDDNPERLKSTIYTAILGRIVTGELLPGQRLVEEDLARAHGVSRTPIREILFALEKDGLVERTRNRGAKVVAFTPDDLDQIYDIRSALECLALRRGIKSMPLNELLAFEKRLEELNGGHGTKWNQWQSEVDLALHRFILTYSGNRRLVSLTENISRLIHSLRLLGYRNDGNAQRAGAEHLAIVRALLRRDLNLAERLLAEHIEGSKRNALEFFFQREAAVARGPGHERR